MEPSLSSHKTCLIKPSSLTHTHICDKYPEDAGAAYTERLGDSFKKIIVVRDKIKVCRNDMGIVTIGARNILPEKNSLNR